MPPTQDIPLFADAQTVNAGRPQSKEKQPRRGQQGEQSKKVVSSDNKSHLSQIVTTATHRAYPQEGRFPSVITDEDTEVRRESVDQYEYVLFYSMHLGTYVVRCSDSHNAWLEFGPLTLLEGQTFIDERLARAEGLKRV